MWRVVTPRTAKPARRPPSLIVRALKAQKLKARKKPGKKITGKKGTFSDALGLLLQAIIWRWRHPGADHPCSADISFEDVVRR
jgi:hypothetical protein